MSNPLRIAALVVLVAAQAALFAQAEKAPAAESAPASQLGGGVDFYQLPISGRSYESIKEEAERHAIATTIGTYYFENRFVVAPELLETYLDKRFKRFIAGTKILEVERGVGTLNCQVQVAVDRARLERDLEEKRFFYEPKRRPYFHISLVETIDRVPSAEGFARGAVADTLRELTARPTPYEITSPAPSLDVEADQEVLYQALVAARRQGIELIITGYVDATLSSQERLYYDDYTFFDASATLKLIRVQDGSLMDEVTLTARAGDADKATAAANAMKRAAADATLKLIPVSEGGENFFRDWTLMTLNDADYRIMVVDITQSDLDAFLNRLRSIPIDPEARQRGVEDARVFLKSFVNGVGVVNLVYKDDVMKLRRAITESRYPRFHVDLFEGKNVKLSRVQQ